MRHIKRAEVTLIISLENRFFNAISFITNKIASMSFSYSAV